MKQLLPAKLMALLLLALSATHVQAATFTEQNDAGESINTAQVIPSGTNPLNMIVGSLSGDVDLFKLFLEGGQTFSATTLTVENLTELPGEIFAGIPSEILEDPQLFLFNADGIGVYGNDDTSFSTQAVLPSGGMFSPTNSGFYYLAISNSGNNPFSNEGSIFPDNLIGDAFGANGAGGGSPLSGFTGTTAMGGRYAISLTGVKTAAARVPEPSSLLGLLGIGALATVSQLKNKKQNRKNSILLS